MIDLKKERNTRILFLCVTISACAALAFYVQYQLDYDRLHAKSDRIYKLVTSLDTPNEHLKSSITSWTDAPKIDSALKDLAETTRIAYSVLRLNAAGSQPITANGLFVEENLFKIFDFPVVKGSLDSVLIEPFSIVLTETAAKQLFRSKDPIGQTVHFGDSDFTATVTGIAKDIPANSQIQTDVFVSMRTLAKLPGSVSKLQNTGVVTYILLNDKTSELPAQEELQKLLSDTDKGLFGHITSKKQWSIEPLRNLFLNPLLSRFHVSLLFVCLLVTLLLLIKSISRVVKIGLLQLSLSDGYSGWTTTVKIRKLVLNVCAEVLAANLLAQLLSAVAIYILVHFFAIAFADILSTYTAISAILLISSVISGLLLSLWVTLRVPAEPIRTYYLIKNGL